MEARPEARPEVGGRPLYPTVALMSGLFGEKEEFREAPEGFKTPAGTLGPLLGLKSPGADHQILEPRAKASFCRRRTKQHPVEEDEQRFIPLRSKKNPLLFGPADAAATEEPAPPSLSGHDYSLDFRNIRATRTCNTVKVTIADLFYAV
ncbi:unnamed protein product [Pleuronectes platessa]|uniref:Uncharacterized protein n=1 Tax=Pleuronectes platessa TaxID=8262 RepID=A0A9N7ZEM8_PLEPL|nr:unnamed protein product [Pleuronectes platessa]